jgi:putative nucleotidyltransferase with HDIG domain
VDAANILLLTPHTQALEFAAGIGFRTHNIEETRVRLGEGHAGTAALQQKVISIPDLNQAKDEFSRNLLLSDEKFISHYVAPLVAKGQIQGVLEIFTRRRLDTIKEWYELFETLATQAAIAIYSATIFNNLQRSNTELKLAYEATIEGWSRALDLRDKETEGHTQRVTEMTLQLAEKIGMSDIEKLELRRGALLHDIGKMGIPDNILLKPGKLTDEEWVIMRQHPIYAYEMLAPISYLERALDIPYCHHEKWDGTGYPRGLRGKQIPLAARIFSIVDVFDALVSDRPYRQAWSKTDAYKYISEQSGTQFDPFVVNAFLDMA